MRTTSIEGRRHTKPSQILFMNLKGHKVHVRQNRKEMLCNSIIRITYAALSGTNQGYNRYGLRLVRIDSYPYGWHRPTPSLSLATPRAQEWCYSPSGSKSLSGKSFSPLLILNEDVTLSQEDFPILPIVVKSNHSHYIRAINTISDKIILLEAQPDTFLRTYHIEIESVVEEGPKYYFKAASL